MARHKLSRNSIGCRSTAGPKFGGLEATETASTAVRLPNMIAIRAGADSAQLSPWHTCCGYFTRPTQL